MLSESLRAVISQTLLKKIGGGRVAAHEIMIGTPAIRNLIREGKIAQMYSAIQTGQTAGMQTLDQCLTELLQKGVVTKEEARFRAQNKEPQVLNGHRQRQERREHGTRTSHQADAGPAQAHGRAARARTCSSRRAFRPPSRSTARYAPSPTGR